MNDSLVKKILITITYYDCLEYPLTSFEIWKYLTSTNRKNSNDDVRKHSLNDVAKELDSENLKNFIAEHNGFYFLRGRQDLVEFRLGRNKIASQKIKKLKRVVWLLRFVPYVRMIGITGRLAMKNTEEKSDWDLLMVLKSGKIWTGRTLITLATHLIGKRRHGNKIKNRICLNYFITDESLEIGTKDMFSAHEYFFMIPIFDTGLHEKFRLKNRWIRNFKPNLSLTGVENLIKLDDSKISNIVRKTGEIILNFQVLENWLKKWQKEKIMRNPKTHRKGSLVLASDSALVFLPDPQGPKVFEKFAKKARNV